MIKTKSISNNEYGAEINEGTTGDASGARGESSGFKTPGGAGVAQTPET